MNDIEQRIAALSPAQRALFEQRLKQKGLGSKNVSTQVSVIPKRQISDAPPLSLAQERFWLMHQLESDIHLYNESNLFRFTGQLNGEALEKSLNEVIKRHEILRTNFQVLDGQTVQIIASDLTLNLPIIDLQEVSEDDREVKVKQIIQEISSRPFDLTQGALLRAILLKIQPNEHLFLVTMHHILCDGWSMKVFFQELANFYQALNENKPSNLPELPIQYADFAIWQREKIVRQEYANHLSYWKQQLAGTLPILELPTDYPRPAVQSFRGARNSLVLSENLTQALKSLSQREGVTLFVLLLTAFKILLYRYTGQLDLLVGTPISDRTQIETERLIGCMLNTLVLRTDLSGNPSFRQLLARVRDVTLAAFTHQELPFEQLVKELQPNRDLSHTPLFQVMFVFLEAPLLSLELPGLMMQPLMVDSGISKFDITLFLEDSKQGLIGAVEYNTDLFKAETIARMWEHFQTLLEGIITDPEQEISNLPLLTATEMRQFVECNDTQIEYPQACIQELFEAQVERTPDAVAVVFEGESLTYKELNQQANQLAHYLRGLGVEAETLVGICLERSLNMIVALLAILKAGGAYLPLDPAYPKERLAYMLEDSQVSLLLTQQHLVETLPPSNARAICLDRDSEILAGESAENLAIASTPENLAYVIYTSGSTGKPKGVLITHGNVVRLFSATQSWFNFDNRDVWTLFHSYAFDFSVWEIWGALLYGGRLIVVPFWVSRSPDAFYQLLCQQQVTVLNQTPSAFRQLMEAEASLGVAKELALRLVIFGGEALELPSLKPWFERHGDQMPQLINMYGITETTVHVTYRPLAIADTNKTASVIGHPIPDLQIYLLDRYKQFVPVGVPGEIYVGGAGLARGYFNRPDLTEEKFISNPFSNQPGARLYKTGDLARYLSDGNIEYLGRIDNQVKIRGFRIELGEIEAVLDQHPEVKQAVVVARQDESGDKRLVAYVVTGGDAIATCQLREYLKQKLPDYMVPSAIVLMDAFPLTPNGKIDRRTLPAPNFSPTELDENFAPPTTPIQELLTGIWQQILGIEKIGIYDNFFSLGGHSLLATQVVSQVKKTFQIELPLRRLFESPTIASFAQFVEQTIKKGAELISPPIERVSRDRTLPLSFSQQRLWFLHQLEPNSAAYNGATVVQLKGVLDVAALEKSLNEIVRRHEVLRTYFSVVEGQPVQKILSNLDVNLAIANLENLPPTEREQAIQQLIKENAQQPFDLSKAPLMQVRLLRLNADEHILLLTLHHIISDAWSAGIFIKEIGAFYEAFSTGKNPSLPELSIQYADFAVWQQQWLQGEILDSQLNYWKQQLDGAKTLLELPTDKPRSLSPTSLGTKYSFTLSPELSKSLQSLSQREGATLFMTLMAAFNTLLYRYTGQNDILVGSPIANRNRHEIEGLIGFFANTLIWRTKLSNNPSFKELIQQVREFSLGAYAHQDLPFEKLVAELQPERHLTHSPLFQVWFVLQNTPMPTLELEGMNLSFLEAGSGMVRHDLKLEVTNVEAGLECFFEYKTDLFEAASIERMAKLFETLLTSVVEKPDRKLNELLEILNLVEKEQAIVKQQEFKESRRQKLGSIQRKSISSMDLRNTDL
jgi:amino acid adenylation domain-containing protein